MLLALSGTVAGCANLDAPLDDHDIALFAHRLATEVDLPQPTDRPLTVIDAVQRARVQNGAIQARRLEAHLADAKAASLSGGLLPKMTMDVEQKWRSVPPASRTSATAPFTVSADTRTTTGIASIAFNPFDLGLSVIRARQGFDKARQAHEEVRRVAEKIAEETRLAFWRSVALNVLEDGLARSAGEVREALALAGRATTDTSVDPMIALSLQRDILTLQRDLFQLQTTLAPAHGQLANLTNALPSRLDRRLVSDLARPRDIVIERDVLRALQNRAEIRQVMYDLRIAADEIDAVVLQALPSATFSLAQSHDSNSYLKFADWRSGSSAITANLGNLLRLASETETVEAQRLVHRQLAVVTAASIQMQLRSAHAQLAASERALQTATQNATNQQRLLKQVTALTRAGKATPQNLVRERLALLVAVVRRTLAFGEADVAVAAYLNAIGEDAGAVLMEVQ